MFKLIELLARFKEILLKRCIKINIILQIILKNNSTIFWQHCGIIKVTISDWV